jgi:hypothetical protein
MYTGLQGAVKLSLAANLMLNWVCAVLSFPQRFQPSTAPAMFIVPINVFAPRAFNPEFQYFIPLFHDFVDNSLEGMKHQMRGCNSGPTGHDFTDNSNMCHKIKIISPSKNYILSTQLLFASDHTQWGHLMFLAQNKRPLCSTFLGQQCSVHAYNFPVQSKGLTDLTLLLC